MSANYNQVLLMGNITRDPELRYTPKGTAILAIGLAVNRKWKDESGEKTDVTFVDITFFGRTAEVLSETHKKGDPIFVSGRLRTESWDDRETGKRRSKLSVIGDSFQFIKPYEEQRQQGPRQPEPESPPTRAPRPRIDDDDVPF